MSKKIIQSDNLAINIEEKRQSTTRKHSTIPIPKKLIPLLELVNLLPIQFRRHKSDRYQEEGKQKKSNHKNSSYRIYESYILQWKDNEDFSIENLWYKLKKALIELPLYLQAFIFNDDGPIIRNETGTTSISPEYQVFNNFKLLEKDNLAIDRIIEKALEKINSKIEVEEALNPTSSDILFKDDNSRSSFKELVLRVRQRLIFVLVAQEMLSWLTEPSPYSKNLPLYLYAWTYYLSDFTKTSPYVDPQTGKLKLKLPILFEPIIDVEASRIRECLYCYKFFWVGRKDVYCCSKKCAHIVRQKKFIKTHPDYKYKRYQQAESKSKINQKEKKQ